MYQNSNRSLCRVRRRTNYQTDRPTFFSWVSLWINSCWRGRALPQQTFSILLTPLPVPFIHSLPFGTWISYAKSKRMWLRFAILNPPTDSPAFRFVMPSLFVITNFSKNRTPAWHNYSTSASYSLITTLVSLHLYDSNIYDSFLLTFTVFLAIFL